MIMIENYSNWWQSLELFEQVYWIIAIPATTIFIIQLIMTFIGGDMDKDMELDGDSDLDHDLDHDPGFHLVTIKNLVAFFTMFGWVGIACISSGLGQGFTIFVSILCGLIMMTIMASLFYFISKLTHSGTLDMNNAIGKIGNVYITIPPKKDGLGKVQIKVQGTLRTLNAMTEDTESIKTGSIIEVEEIANDEILIVKRSR